MSDSRVQALQSDQITAIGIGIIAVIIVLGFLLSLVFAKILAKLLVLVVVVGLAILVWQQRTSIENKVNTKTCDLSGATFFGVHVDAPDDVKKSCNGSD